MAENVINLTEADVVTDEELQQSAKEAAEAVQNVMDDFSDEVPCDEEEEEALTEEDKKKASSFLNNFKDFITSDKFKEQVNSAAKEYKVPPKKVAEGFFAKCLGTVGDVLGVVISVGANACHTLINILSSVAHGAVNLMTKIADGLARIITFNKTCACKVAA